MACQFIWTFWRKTNHCISFTLQIINQSQFKFTSENFALKLLEPHHNLFELIDFSAPFIWFDPIETLNGKKLTDCKSYRRTKICRKTYVDALKRSFCWSTNFCHIFKANETPPKLRARFYKENYFRAATPHCNTK